MLDGNTEFCDGNCGAAVEPLNALGNTTSLFVDLRINIFLGDADAI